MDDERRFSTNKAYYDLTTNHQGGGFVISSSGNGIDVTKDQTAIIGSKGFKKFSVSIYNQQNNTEEVTLHFLVNPSDISNTFTAITRYVDVEKETQYLNLQEFHCVSKIFHL